MRRQSCFFFFLVSEEELYVKQVCGKCGMDEEVFVARL